MSETEDIPSDFFDDFNKEDFMQGLSVIDSWDDEERGSRVTRITEALDSVKDLRELIGDSKEPEDDRGSNYKKDFQSHSTERNSKSIDPLDNYIKPGSRRDPNKTNEAIRKDKEVKVKEILAKHLGSDELCPPGTELDEFFEEGRPENSRGSSKARRKPVEEEPYHHRSRSNSRERRPIRYQDKGRGYEFDQGRSYRRSSPRRSPIPSSPRHRRAYSPVRSPRRVSPHHYKRRHSPFRLRAVSPRSRFSPKRSRISPRRPRISPRRSRYSPSRSSPRRRRPSISPPRVREKSKTPINRDNFLYPSGSSPTVNYPTPTYQQGQQPGYNGPITQEYPGNFPGYVYPQVPAYTGSTGYSGNDPYQYAGVTIPTTVTTQIPLPQPVPAPIVNQITPTPAPVPIPMAPVVLPTKISPPSQSLDLTTPFDALAQLVADGKLSKEDYLKLAPHKGSSSPMDTKTRVLVLNRCNEALTKLGKFSLPNRLVMNNNIVGQEPKCLTPKYSSPLKRQAVVDFNFTTTSQAKVLQNKQLVDSIIETIGLGKVISRPKKKISKNMKDASVQTSKPFCDVCAVRDSIKLYDASTTIENEHFSSSVHTQIEEQDLLNSKAIFNPSGSTGNTGLISIAHLTPAQLVSQLAARAKTLKHNYDDPQSSAYRRPNYDYEGRSGNSSGSGQNFNNYNYRY